MDFTVAFIDPPKQGKKLANIKTQDGKRIGYDPAKFAFAVGKTYDATVSENPWEGKIFLRIESAKEIAASTGGGNGAAPYSDRFYMPFVSNVVAHAIAAGILNDPLQIKVWAAAAKEAALSLDNAVRHAGEDDIEF